ncbi:MULTISPECIES: hypothetical protein [unclassified Beijerinckia]|uniref:hypothetical protein n=1 Tax=unclassified Beijerinckia TaxID=2638183 RepID=UPI00089ACED8|nr:MULTISPECIES: hypothetical protein [unclassified Beijerinckia]MDH7797516.1 hypothetical protein [Beijerinckia sp. GAS462]SEC88708.1 hypothetical protein SAMN05443249_3810 [Beijerinckia sp. 28-YEA-48]
MTERVRLSNRRPSELIDFEFRGRPYILGLSRYRDGRVSEVFIDAPKAATDAGSDARDAAVALRIAFQHGVPADAIRAAVTREADGTAAGIVGAALDIIAGG